MEIAIIIFAIVVLGLVATLKIILNHRYELLKLEALQDNVDYKKGFNDGLEQAALLITQSSNAMISNVYTPAPIEFAKLIRASIKVKD